MLSVCPLSNVFLKCVTKVAELPIRKFLDAGVRFSINSDDPAYVSDGHTFILDILLLILMLQFGNNYILDNYVAVQVSALLQFLFQLAQVSTTSSNYLRSTHHHPSCPTSRYFALDAIGNSASALEDFAGQMD